LKCLRRTHGMLASNAHRTGMAVPVRG
jgi:hypothetical protein